MTANGTADLKLAIWLRWGCRYHPRIYVCLWHTSISIYSY